VPGTKKGAEKWKDLGHRDAETLREEWPRHSVGTGVLTGPSGLVVVDLDGDGESELRKLANGRTIPETYTQLTPSGGKHLVFRVPKGRAFKTCAGQVGPGIDVRGRGGLFVIDSGEPGKVYEVADDRDPVLPPAWLADLLPAPGSPSASTAGWTTSGPLDIQELLETGAEPGQQENVLYRLVWNSLCQGESKASAYRTWLAILDKSVTGVNAKGEAVPGWTRADFDEKWDNTERTVSELDDELDAVRVSVEKQLRARDKKKKASVLGQILDRTDLGSLPKPEPLIEGWLDLRTTVVLAGATGTNKTFGILGWACSIVTGCEWLGHKVAGKYPAILVVGEGAGGLDSRISAWEEDAGEKLQPGMLTILRMPPSIMDPKFWKALAALARKLGARFIALDTFSSLAPDADETTDAASVIRWMEQMKVDIDGTVVLAHHSGWSDKLRVRGGSQLEANPDSVIIASKTKEEDEDAPVRIWLKKNKDGPNGRKLWVTRVPVGTSCVLEVVEAPSSGSGDGSTKLLNSDDRKLAISEWLHEHGSETKTTICEAVWEQNPGTGRDKWRATIEAMIRDGALISGGTKRLKRTRPSSGETYEREFEVWESAPIVQKIGPHRAAHRADDSGDEDENND
jgi:hypothetical protein